MKTTTILFYAGTAALCAFCLVIAAIGFTSSYQVSAHLMGVK